MPSLKTRNLFISHSWKYDEHYEKVVEWFDGASNFSWKNYSVPQTDSCDGNTKSELEKCLDNQMRPTQAIIILAGMWVNYSDWITYEIEEAVRMNKTIIGVKPWGGKVMPKIVQDNSDVIVNWQKDSVIQAVRDYV